ncbi:MAG TPA: sigma 54-interacting transcriptional regulator [Bacteroidales bacterium]|nr:sigma 54-interacting transcriptional regulator [Bacteroidales bacterium]
MKTGEKKYTELSFLYDISKELQKVKHIEESIKPILKHLADYCGISCCSLTILNADLHHVILEEYHGLKSEEVSNLRGKLEKVSKTIIETGEPMLLPKMSHTPTFIKSSRDLVDFSYEISMICVPIKAAGKVLGFFAFSLEYYNDISFKLEFRILNIIGSMLAHSIIATQENAYELALLRQENLKLQDQLNQAIINTEIIGNSSAMQSVFELIQKVSKTNATVLLRGESGVGKELIANAIHYNSARKDKPLIKVNCSALPDTLIESELFGHEKGAFTGADGLRKGRFELADGGTIFLDEIGDLPLPTQVKILRILQEREFERLGGSKTLKIDVRIITATNRNLEEMITKCEFREDLFYRLNVFPIYIPSLRERRNDIPILVNHFIAKANKRHGLKIKRISTSAIDLLMMYHWPGNIRELENVIERAAILSIDDVIRSNNLPPTLQTAESSKTKMEGTLEDIVANVEKQVIIDNLISTHGCTFETAQKLGITERILRLRLHKYNIEPKRFKKVSK